MIRPTSFDTYVGQERVKKLIQCETTAKKTPRHMLFYGQPGLGKTSLAKVVSHASGLQFHAWQASRQMTPQKLGRDLLELSIEGYDEGGSPLNSNAARHLVFIDEIHELPNFEVFYPVLEDRVLNPDPYGGASWIPMTCFIFATTDPFRLPKPFVDRLPLQLRLDPYNASEIGEIVRLQHPKLKAKEIDAIAARSRGVARIAVNFADSVATHGLDYFETMEIDDSGLTKLDRDVLAVLQKAGRPISLNTLAAMVRENPTTIRDVVEPYLLSCGLMEITPRGRAAVGLSAVPTSRGPLGAELRGYAR